MIVNTTMSQSGLMDPPQCENFYLKRKLGQDDQNENGQSYVQPKKRHIQNFSTNNLFSVETNCNEINFNLNNSAFINDLFNYDQTLSPVVQTASVYASDSFDPNWHNTAELLELDQKYNSTIISTQNSYEEIQSQTLGTHQNDSLSQIAHVTNVIVDQPSANMSYEKSNQVENNNNNNNNNIHSNNNNNNNQNSSLRNSAGQRGQLKNSDKIFNSFNNLENESNDFEDKNLSWLFNFKLDELPHLSPEVHSRSAQNQKSNQQQMSSSTSSSPSNQNNIKSPKSSQSRTGKRFEELVMEVISPDIDASEMSVGENVVVENSPRMPKKPPFTYTELIEYALEDKGELTVSGIYQWISDRFPFYKSNDDRWKNSVRHNLSINPHFRKGVKAPQGAGHLWTISSGDSEENVLAWEHKKQRLELFFKMESIHREKDTSNKENAVFDEAAAAAATITQEMHNNHSPEPNQCHLASSIHDDNRLVAHNPDMPLISDLINDDDLRRSAGEILNGIRRDVEVQAINSIINTYQDSLLDSEDYLNPINKDIAINESGLRNDSSFYVTEIDPIELGINMGNVEEEVLFSDEFNLNYFGITAGNDIVA